MQDRVEVLEKKSKDRLNALLEVDNKLKETELQLSRSVAELNQLSEKSVIK